MDPTRKVIIKTPAEKRINILSNMRNLSAIQQEKYNRRQVHALYIDNAYQDIQGAALEKMSMVELRIRTMELNKQHEEFNKEHKALSATLKDENFQIAADVAKYIDKMYLDTSVKMQTKLVELLDSKKGNENCKKKSKKTKKTKESIEVPKRPKEKRKAELMRQCFGSSSDNESENKRRKLQTPRTSTSTDVEEPQTINQTVPIIESPIIEPTPIHTEEILELTTETELEQISDQETVSSSRNVPNIQSAAVQPELQNQLNDYRAEQSAEHRPDYRADRAVDVQETATRKRSLTCYYCSGNHPMSDCGPFRDLDVPTRRQEIDRLGLCRNCFAPMNINGRIHRCIMGPCFRCRRNLYHNSLVCLLPPGARQFY